MISVVTRYFWDLRKRRWFWTIIALIVALHIPILLLVRWPSNQYSYMQMLPIGLLDFAIMYGVIRLAENIFEKNSARQ